MKFSVKPFSLILLMLLLLCKSGAAQESSGRLNSRDNMHLGGYIKYMNIVVIPELDGNWMFDNLIHNRLNYHWKLSEHWKLQVEMRNRIIYGQSVQVNPVFGQMFDQSLDYIDLGTNLVEENSFVIHSVFDRANLTWSKGKWLATLGKQRINWSQSYVWNPNDIFNAYSFFDFDYEERRGSDALLLRYATGPLSSLQFAISLHDDPDSLTAGVYHRFNRWNYDFQIITGKYQTDVYTGIGWSGQIKTLGFKGEISYFHPYKDETRGKAFVGNISFDYRFPNTLNLRLETIYHSNPGTAPDGAFFQQPVTARTLVFNHFSAFASAGYEITPLIRAGLNGIWNADDQSWFVNPNLTVSLNENTELLLALQSFGGEPGSLYAGFGNYLYTRLKFNF